MKRGFLIGAIAAILALLLVVGVMELVKGYINAVYGVHPWKPDVIWLK